MRRVDDIRARRGAPSEARRGPAQSSQRQSVLPLMVATRPRANTSRRKSDKDHRASGTRASTGSSHAIRLISTTTLGGKAG